MSVIPSALTAAILAAGPPGSQHLPKVAMAVGNAVPSWLPSPTNVLSQGVTAGLAGTGIATGKLFFVASGQVVASLAAAGLTGPSSQSIGIAVEIGVSAVLNASAQYLGVSVGVSTGSDTTKVSLSNPATLIALLSASLPATGVAGPLASQMAVGLGQGISSLVQTGFGFGGVAPLAPAPAPGAGTSASIVF